MDLAELHKSDKEIMDKVFHTISHLPKSEQRLIMLDYLEERHDQIIQWTSK